VNFHYYWLLAGWYLLPFIGYIRVYKKVGNRTHTDVIWEIDDSPLTTDYGDTVTMSVFFYSFVCIIIHLTPITNNNNIFGNLVAVSASWLTTTCRCSLFNNPNSANQRANLFVGRCDEW
jgi:hypothetical protein